MVCDFVFSLKAPQLITASRKLGETGELIRRFVEVGPPELGPKLGPILWQMPKFKRFDAADFEVFLQLLPGKSARFPLRHVLGVRHQSFLCPEFLGLALQYGMACVFTDSGEYPSFADLTRDVVYARLVNARRDQPLGYTPDELDKWAVGAKCWASGGEPDGLPHVEWAAIEKKPREVFVFAINGANECAPAAAMALLERLGRRFEGVVPAPIQSSLF